MRPLIQEIATGHTPESLVECLRGEPCVVLLRTSSFDSPSARYSFVAARPFLTFRTFGSRCEISRPQTPDARPHLQFGNPWQILDALLARCELLDEIDLAIPARRRLRLLGLRPEKFHRAETPAPRRQRPRFARLPRRLL
jgi:anthranilate/para-aminobenzoate synthase component I